MMVATCIIWMISKAMKLAILYGYRLKEESRKTSHLIYRFIHPIPFIPMVQEVILDSWLLMRTVLMFTKSIFIRMVTSARPVGYSAAARWPSVQYILMMEKSRLLVQLNAPQ